MLVIEVIYIIGGIPAIGSSGIFFTASLGIVGMALNPKRMPKAVFYKLKLQFNWARESFFLPVFFFCQQVQIFVVN